MVRVIVFFKGDLKTPLGRSEPLFVVEVSKAYR
jgi:hypothetical protein